MSLNFKLMIGSKLELDQRDMEKLKVMAKQRASWTGSSDVCLCGSVKASGLSLTQLRVRCGEAANFS